MLRITMSPTKTKLKPRTKKHIQTIKERFLTHYPKAKTELIYHNMYELLVCVMLSAQCTDKRVNIVTPRFFARFSNPDALAEADVEEIKEYIKSISFFNNKAAHLKAMAKRVVEDFNGKIPTTQEELKSLPGVGQKSANVVLIEYMGENLMAVDTHVFRVSHRLGLSHAKTPAQTESNLQDAFRTDLGLLHQAFVLFGRYVCKAQKPLCSECFVQEFCTTTANFKPA